MQLFGISLPFGKKPADSPEREPSIRPAPAAATPKMPAHLPPGRARHVNGGGWVAATASVAATAFVGRHALVEEGAEVRDFARIDGHAQVRGRAIVRDRAIVRGHANVCDDALIKDEAVLDGYASARGNAVVAGNASVGGKARVELDAYVHGWAMIVDGAQVTGHARVGGTARLTGETRLAGSDEDDGLGVRSRGTTMPTEDEPRARTTPQPRPTRLEGTPPSGSPRPEMLAPQAPAEDDTEDPLAALAHRSPLGDMSTLEDEADPAWAEDTRIRGESFANSPATLPDEHSEPSSEPLVEDWDTSGVAVETGFPPPATAGPTTTPTPSDLTFGDDDFLLLEEPTSGPAR